MIETNANTNVALFKECFKKLTIKELINRIQLFRQTIDLRNVSEKRLREELRKLFYIEFDGENWFFFLDTDVQTSEYEKRYFYRIRKFVSKDYDEIESCKFPSMSTEKDVWARPSHLVNEYGRLNRPKESVLYVSSMALNAVYETNCEIGEWFFLLVYENVNSMRISQIHEVSYLDDFTEEENAKKVIMHEFLLNEFTKLVPSGREYLYKTPLLIYEEFFKKSANDGFTYPSISSHCNLGHNMCFTKEQYEKNLNFKGVMVCYLAPSYNGSEFRLLSHYDGYLSANGFTFHPSNSKESRQKFEKFALIRDMWF